MPLISGFATPEREFSLTVPLAAATVDGNVFVATRRCKVVAIAEAHAAAGTDAGAVTLAVKKCTGTQAPSAGTAVHTGSANLKGTADTVQNLGITDAAATLAPGNRLAIDATGVLTALAGGILTIRLRYV